MKCTLSMYILSVVILLTGIIVTDVNAMGTISSPEPFYVKLGNDAFIQCKNEDEKLFWAKQTNITVWKSIANRNRTIDSTKYKVSVNPDSGLYYRLHILNAQSVDASVYRCVSGSTAYIMQLFLYEPPTGVNFHGSKKDQLKGSEGTNLLIKCIADGGKPPPDVSILNGSMSNGTQEVSYTIPNISRDYHQKSIVCHATSVALNSPVTAVVQIYLNLKPLSPIFDTNEVVTVETNPLTVSCTSHGSLPAANFTWTIGGKDVTSSSTELELATGSDDTKTIMSTLKSYRVDRSNDKQSIICKASNTVGSASANKTLDVQYAPNITVNSPEYTQDDNIRTVTCSPDGNPDSYTYLKWQHKSKYGAIIREFEGNQTLTLPNGPENLRYQDNGEYLCTASNGIKDKNNEDEQTGSGYVTLSGLPVFTSDNKKSVKQYGEIKKVVDIYVNVYSVPKFTSFEWTCEGKIISTKGSTKYESSSSSTIVQDKIGINEVQLDGFNVTLTINDLIVEDFTNYTVTLTSDGFPNVEHVEHTIILESAGVPEAPGNFTSIASSTSSITIQWDSSGGGGYKQIFYTQYRVQGSSEWTTVPAGEEDINNPKTRRTYEVRYLQEGKAYELRMYAENTAMKRSNFTSVLIALTDSGSGPSVAAIVGGIAGCLIAIIIVLLVIVFVQKKRKENGTASTKLRASSENEEEDGLKDNILYESSQSDGLKTNALYQSAEPDFVSLKKPSTSSEYAVVQKPNAIYAEVNKMVQPKNAKEKKQKDKKGKPKKTTKEKTKAMNNNPEEEYANSAVPLRNLNDGNSTDSQGPSDHHPNAQRLEYADLTFRQIPAKNKKQVIHGIDERTIYADVDHTKKAPPPPPESEYEETNIKHGKMA